MLAGHLSLSSASTPHEHGRYHRRRCVEVDGVVLPYTHFGIGSDRILPCFKRRKYALSWPSPVMSTFPRVECVTVTEPVSVDVPLREHTHMSARMCLMLTTDAPVPVLGLCLCWASSPLPLPSWPWMLWSRW